MGGLHMNLSSPYVVTKTCSKLYQWIHRTVYPVAVSEVSLNSVNAFL
jgi:hypothetical protein